MFLRGLLASLLLAPSSASALALQAPAALLPSEGPPASAQADTCRQCHAQLEGTLGDPARRFPDDIHAARGFSCAGCHGGDPREGDLEKSMDRTKGFIGAPERSKIPQLCARCHSDGAFMRGYNPSLRTDQLALYRTSVHGRRLAQGDTRVAVCSDCHRAHSIRPASSTVSSVHPLQVPETCGRCHADAAYMKPYKIPTDQLAGYRASVHYRTLIGGDLSAPTCATCHGNHGAAPPGVASVERVCGTCHVFQEKLFDQSPHKAPWEAAKMAACLTCHGNHRIERTRDALVGTGRDSLCATCHADGDGGWKNAQKIHAALTGLDSSLGRASAILERAERAGMEVSEARLTLSSAQEKLIKARVDVHTMDAARVAETAESGMKPARLALQAGQQALAEYAYRRKGLALSLFAIAFVVLSLWLLIRDLERKQSAGGKTG